MISFLVLTISSISSAFSWATNYKRDWVGSISTCEGWGIVYTIEHLTVLITPWEERVGGWGRGRGEEDGMGTRNSSPISVFASSLPYPTHSGSCDSQPPYNCANHQNPRILHGTLWWLWSRWWIMRWWESWVRRPKAPRTQSRSSKIFLPEVGAS